MYVLVYDFLHLQVRFGAFWFVEVATAELVQNYLLLRHVEFVPHVGHSASYMLGIVTKT
jgi:hypothetical protein